MISSANIYLHILREVAQKEAAVKDIVNNNECHLMLIMDRQTASLVLPVWNQD